TEDAPLRIPCPHWVVRDVRVELDGVEIASFQRLDVPLDMMRLRVMLPEWVGFAARVGHRETVHVTVIAPNGIAVSKTFIRSFRTGATLPEEKTL
ncbi:MAG: hypothetical protein PHU85_17370, partial [Phycisphaerae bacterium]|nr:hypothetical protein [Phycisphaerae bacterium]